MKPRIVLAGGSGFIGQALAPALLIKSLDVVILTRGAPQTKDGIRFERWDGKQIGNWMRVVDGALAVVNLAGRSINCRHTCENRRQIVESRVDSVRALGEAVRRSAQPPKVFVQAAGVGIYGDKGERWCDENTPHGDDFVTQVCEHWEAAFDSVDAGGARKVLLRLGVALGPNGGFLSVLSRLTRAFLGGHVGSGRQFISWIHIIDLAQMFLAAIEREDIAGVFNATSPNPVTNAELMSELRRALHRPWSPPVPKFAARVGSWLIGTQADLAFVSQRCEPKRFLESGFKFQFPELRPALANIYSNS
jgi:uncharacterized protein (TIGR01777 family)